MINGQQFLFVGLLAVFASHSVELFFIGGIIVVIQVEITSLNEYGVPTVQSPKDGVSVLSHHHLAERTIVMQHIMSFLDHEGHSASFQIDNLTWRLTHQPFFIRSP